jgi:hypothetical protein
VQPYRTAAPSESADEAALLGRLRRLKKSNRAILVVAFVLLMPAAFVFAGASALVIGALIAILF